MTIAEFTRATDGDRRNYRGDHHLHGFIDVAGQRVAVEKRIRHNGGETYVAAARTSPARARRITAGSIPELIRKVEASLPATAP